MSRNIMCYDSLHVNKALEKLRSIYGFVDIHTNIYCGVISKLILKICMKAYFYIVSKIVLYNLKLIKKIIKFLDSMLI